MKFLVTWSWKAKNGREVTERFKEWQPAGGKFLFPIHTIIGENKAFTVVEIDSTETMAKNIQGFTDLCVFRFSPIMESRKLVSL